MFECFLINKIVFWTSRRARGTTLEARCGKSVPRSDTWKYRDLSKKRGAGGPKQAQNEVQVVPEGDSGDDFGNNKNQRHNTIITGTDLGSISGSFWRPESINWGINFVLISVMCFLSPLEMLIMIYFGFGWLF